jgi:hypothetical protein
VGLAAQHAQRAQAHLVAAAQGRTARGVEDEILRVESEVPGFGGMYFDPGAGRFVAFVRDPGARGRAVAALRVAAARWGNAHPEARSLAGGEVDVRTGAFAFSDLMAWQQALLPALGRVAGVVGIDADERENRVTISVTNDAAAAEIGRVAAAVGVPTQAIAVRRSPAIKALQSNVRSYTRPLAGGFQIENVSRIRCTIGWNVTTTLGETGFLTAGHCAAGNNGAGSTGGSIYQAEATSSSNIVGNVAINPTWTNGCWTSASSPPLGFYGGYFSGPCTEADVMFVSTSAANADKVLAVTSNVATNNVPGSINYSSRNGLISSPVFAFVGAVVDKVGRTTGTTRGTVQATCTAAVVQGSPNYVVTCADRVETASSGKGDSGAPVYRLIGNGRYPLGTLFAGNLNWEDFDGEAYCDASRGAVTCTYLYAPWSNIQNRLGRTFVPQP